LHTKSFRAFNTSVTAVCARSMTIGRLTLHDGTARHVIMISNEKPDL